MMKLNHNKPLYFLLVILVTTLISINVVSATFFHPRRSYFNKITQNNEPVVENFGVHEAVPLGNDIFMFGGIRENRTTFWQEGTSFVEFYADTRTFNPYTGLHQRVNTVDGVEPGVRGWFGADSDGYSKAFIYGGLAPPFVNLDDFWIYDKHQNKWTQKGGSSLTSVTNNNQDIETKDNQDNDDELLQARKIMAHALLNSNNNLPDEETKTKVKAAVETLQKHHRLQQNQKLRSNVLTSDPQEYPGPLNGPGIVYDDDTEEVFLFGGLKDFVAGNNDVYKYDLNTETWTRLTLASDSPVPMGRTLPELALRKTQGGNKRELIMYGGEAFFFDIQYYRYVCDMWVFDIDARKWTELVAPVTEITEHEKAHVPVCRLHYAAVYDPWIDQMHFHGGDYGNCTCTDLITSRTMIYDFPTNKFVDDVYESTADCNHGLFSDTECELYDNKDNLDPKMKRAKFTRMPNGKVFMTGGFFSEEPGNIDQRYPNDIYKYRPRNIDSIRIKFGYVKGVRIPQEVTCPENDESIC